MSKSKLKICPCCKGKAKLTEVGSFGPVNAKLTIVWWQVQCSRCGLSTEVYLYKKCAIKAWERRGEE